MTQIAEASVKLSVDMDQFTQGMKLAVEEMNKVGQEMTKFGAAMSLKVTLPLSIAAGIAVKEFTAEADALERLNIVLDSTKNIAGQTAAGIQRMADAIQETTRFSSTQVIEGAAMLATFQKVRNVVGEGNRIFDRAIDTAAKLASGGRDLAGTMQMLGRALENPAMGMQILRRQGILFTETQKDTIRSLVDQGKILEAQKIILDKVASSWKDATERMAKTPAGHFAQMWNEVKDALKEAAKPLVVILVLLSDVVRVLAKAFKALPEPVQAVITLILALAAATGPALIAIANLNRALAFMKTLITMGTLRTGFQTLIGLVGKLRIAMMGLSASIPIIGVALAVFVGLWIRHNKIMDEAAAASEEATNKMRMAMAAVSPESALRRLKHFEGLVARDTAEIDKLTEALKAADKAAAMPHLADMSDTASLAGIDIRPGMRANDTLPIPQQPAGPPEGSMTAEERKAHNDRLAFLKTEIARRQEWIAILKDVLGAAEDANEMLANAISEANKKMEESVAVARAMGKVMGPSFNVAAAEAAALEEKIKTVAAAMAKAKKTPEEIAAAVREMTEEFKAKKLKGDLFEIQRAFDQAGKESKIMAGVVGPSFNFAAQEVSRLETQIRSTIEAMKEKPPKEIERAIAGMSAALREAKLDAALFEVDQAFVQATRDAQIMGQIMGPSFNQAAAEAAALKQLIDDTIRSMREQRKTNDEIVASVGKLTQAWRGMNLNAQITEMNKQLDLAMKHAEFMGRVMGPSFSVAATQADALRGSIEQIAQAMFAEGKSIEEVERATQHLQVRMRQLMAKPNIGDFFQQQMGLVVDAFMNMVMSVDQTDSRVKALREEISTLEKGIKQTGDTTGEMTLKLADLRGELSQAESASQSFFDMLRDFIRQAIADFTRLLIQVQLLKLVMGIGGSVIPNAPDIPDVDTSGIPAFDPSSIGVGSMPDIPSVPELPGGALGMKFAPGELGLVGEAGPEIIRAGRSGATVARIAPTPKGKEEGEGVSVTVNNHISAMDSRDVSRLFQENEGAVGSAVTRAVQRSFTLRKMINR